MEETNKIATETAVKTQEDKYPIKDLIENCEALTSYKKEVAVGALSNCSKSELTKNDFKKIVKDFLKRKVK